MTIFSHGSRRAAASASVPSRCTSSPGPRRWHAARERTPIKIPPIRQPAPAFPVIDACPSPTCQCRAMPPGLDIEREQDLNGSMPAYAQHVLLCTGESDWKSRIEDEAGAHGDVVRQLKRLLGPRGKFSDPYHNVLLTASSLPPTPPPLPPPLSKPPKAEDQNPSTSTSALLLPSFTYIPHIPTNDPTTLETLTQAFLLPTHLHPSHTATLTPSQQATLLRRPTLQHLFPSTRPVTDILILICGHGGRDARCGTLGPILHSEFEDQLRRHNISIATSPPHVLPDNGEGGEAKPSARVALISHIGGHKWAGNVIIYVPPSWNGHALAGKGIWYGRVEPRSVEGIVRETVVGGRVVREFFRGGVDGDGRGKVLRL